MSLPFQLEGLSLFAILSLLALLAFAFCLRAPSACLGLVVGFIGALLWSHKAAITAYFVSCFTRLFASAVPHLPSVVSDCFLLGLWQDPFLMMALLWRILEGTINTCACVARFLSPVGIAVAQFVTFFGTMTMPFAYKHFLALAVRAGDRLQTCLWIAVATVVACLSPLLAILVDCVLVPCWEEIIVPTSSVITVWSAAQLQELRKSPTDALVAWLRATSGTASAVLRFLGLMAVGILVLAGSAFTAVAVRITATVLSGYKAAICWTTLRAVPWVCHLTVILMEEPAVASCSTMLAADILEASLGASEVLALVPFLWLAHGDKSAMLASLYRFSETASTAIRDAFTTILSVSISELEPTLVDTEHNVEQIILINEAPNTLIATIKAHSPTLWTTSSFVPQPIFTETGDHANGCNTSAVNANERDSDTAADIYTQAPDPASEILTTVVTVDTTSHAQSTGHSTNQPQDAPKASKTTNLEEAAFCESDEEGDEEDEDDDDEGDEEDEDDDEEEDDDNVDYNTSRFRAILMGDRLLSSSSSTTTTYSDGDLEAIIHGIASLALCDAEPELDVTAQASPEPHAQSPSGPYRRPHIPLSVSFESVFALRASPLLASLVASCEELEGALDATVVAAEEPRAEAVMSASSSSSSSSSSPCGTDPELRPGSKLSASASEFLPSCFSSQIVACVQAEQPDAKGSADADADVGKIEIRVEDEDMTDHEGESEEEDELAGDEAAGREIVQSENVEGEEGEEPVKPRKKKTKSRRAGKKITARRQRKKAEIVAQAAREAMMKAVHAAAAAFQDHQAETLEESMRVAEEMALAMAEAAAVFQGRQAEVDEEGAEGLVEDTEASAGGHVEASEAYQREFVGVIGVPAWRPTMMTEMSVRRPAEMIEATA